MDTKNKRRGPQRVTGRPAPKAPVRRQRKLRDSDVVYTPPKSFKRGRFLLHLATVAAVVLAVVLGSEAASFPTCPMLILSEWE